MSPAQEPGRQPNYSIKAITSYSIMWGGRILRRMGIQGTPLGAHEKNYMKNDRGGTG